MKKLLFVAVILTGCTRDYMCDAGPPCEAPDVETEGNVSIALGTKCDIKITVGYFGGKWDAEKICNETYNNDPMVVPPPDGIDPNTCTCEEYHRIGF